MLCDGARFAVLPLLSEQHLLHELRSKMSLLQSESDLPEECQKWNNLTMLKAHVSMSAVAYESQVSTSFARVFHWSQSRANDFFAWLTDLQANEAASSS